MNNNHEISKDKDDNGRTAHSETSEESFALILRGPAKEPQDSEIGTIFIDSEYRLQRFVTTVTDLINVESFSMNFALEDFTRRLAYNNIKEDIDNVRENNIHLSREVHDQSGRWYMMELRPYLTKDKVEGVVITFVDITELKETKEELAKKVEENKELQREIINNDVAQRWKIGRYLHDELAQSLIFAVLIIDNMIDKLEEGENILPEEITELKNILKENVARARDLSHNVIPINLEEEMGMLNAFSKLAKQLEKTNDVQCELEYDSTMDTIDDKELATHLYQTAHEAAKNAAVHGDAKNVKITLKSDNEYLHLNIEDDGIGFTDHSKEEGGMGINIMRHRMELIGGTLAIKNNSSLGNTGATISCKIPIEKV